MKRCVIVVLLLLFFAGTPHLCLAATHGNTADVTVPSGDGLFYPYGWDRVTSGYVKMGLETEHAFEHELSDVGANITSAEYEATFYAVKISYTALDRFEPYAKIGFANFKTSWNDNGVAIEEETDTGIAWTGGLKVFIWEWTDWGLRFGLDSQLGRAEADIDTLKDGDASPIIQSQSFEYTQWQTALLVSRNFEFYAGGTFFNVVPYMGVRYADLYMKVKAESDNGVMRDIGGARSDGKFGLILGAELLPPDKFNNFAINLEGRLIDENAISVGATVKF